MDPSGRVMTHNDPSPEMRPAAGHASTPIDVVGASALAGGFVALVLAVVPAPWFVCIAAAGVALVVSMAALSRSATRGGAVGACGLVGTGTSIVAVLITIAMVKFFPDPVTPPVYAQPHDNGYVYENEDYVEQPAVTSPPASPVQLRAWTVTATSSAPDGVDDDDNVVSFAAENVIDGDTATAWRTPGSGIGETLTFTFDSPVHLTSVGVVAGYNKVDQASNVDRFLQNRRLREARFAFADVATVDWSYADDREMQRNPVDVEVTTVTMTVLASTEKAERDFTAVSEVEFYGWVVQ